MTKSEITDAFSIQREMLRKTGVWPEEHSDMTYKFRNIISWIFVLSLTITMWIEVINQINDFGKLSEVLYVTVTMTVTVVKLTCLTYYRKIFIRTINSLNLPVFSSYPEEIDHYMAKMIKFMVFLTKLYRYLCLCCIVMYAVYPFLDNKKLPFRFSYDLGKYTYFMYVYQVVAIAFHSWNTSTTDTLFASLLGIGAAQLDILAAKILNLLDDDVLTNNSKITEYQLKQCVIHHLAIMRYIQNVEKIFSIAIFAQFIGSTFIICNTLFYFILISRTSSLFFLLADYLIIMIIELFMFCWYGNEIIVKSLKVTEACYMNKWYNHGKNVRKYLFIMMERSRRPISMKVFSISHLSLDAFKSIIQWSYSCFALLLNLYYAEP